MSQKWRPEGWESQPPVVDGTSAAANRIYEAGADAMLTGIVKWLKENAIPARSLEYHTTEAVERMMIVPDYKFGELGKGR